MSDRHVAKRVVIVGAGLGGMTAAQAVADHFEEVVVLERDALAAGASPRAGVPQGRHPHLLLAGGLNALLELFPGIDVDLARAGAFELDAALDVCCELPGQAPMPRRHLGLRTYAMSRPLLELVVRCRIGTRSNIILRNACRAVEILGSRDGSRVLAVRCESDDKKSEVIPADLVIDASGRGAITLDFLGSVGRPRPEETRIGVDLSYSTAGFSLSESAHPDFKGLMTLAKAPESSRCGYLLQIENDRWLALVVGRGPDPLPDSGEAFFEYTKRLEMLTLFNAIKEGKQNAKISHYRFPESTWRHFAKLDGFPRGLIPIADAICRFNPAYGQGMSVAVKEASALARLLQMRFSGDPLAELAKNFLAEAESIIEAPWTLAALPDFVYPQTTGNRPADLDDSLKRQMALNRLAVRDPVVHKLLLEVHHLLKPISVLNDPDLLARAMTEADRD
jgi:2-polyprenyl-6-methoxyphenol hydroxylase-like FAD-dependent oxidoreductase